MMDDQLLEEVDDVEDVRVDTINEKGEFSDKKKMEVIKMTQNKKKQHEDRPK